MTHQRSKYPHTLWAQSSLDLRVSYVISVSLLTLTCCHTSGVFAKEPHTQEADRADARVEESIAEAADDDQEELESKEALALKTDTGTNEDPDAVRHSEQLQREQELDGELPREEPWEFDVYGSVRLHAINTYNFENEKSSRKIGDGASRLGASGLWNFSEGWSLFGRLETGFDILDSFTPRASGDEDSSNNARLHFIGLESDNVYIKVGKSWSTYYTVAGAADRFSIFGGQAAGVYNAGTDGGATGTGRANQAIQTRFDIDTSNFATIKPFNLNVQYQNKQPIPHVDGQDYSRSYSASAWLENESEVGVGIAYHRATIDNLKSPAVREAGIDGDATAAALAFKTYGDRWLASLVLSNLKNIETTNELKYVDALGAELFAQWEFTDKFWLVGGGNWLYPDEDDPDAGEYELKYGVLGIRYTLDSFNRMIYAEWRDDYSTTVDGRQGENEFTIGIRWDLGY